MNHKTYQQGYLDGFQEGIELMALAMACRLHLTVGETLAQVPESADLKAVRQMLVEAGIPDNN